VLLVCITHLLLCLLEKNLYDIWMAGGSKRALYGTSENGWTDTNLFSSWFKKGFLTWTKDVPRPLLLIFDRHMSHRPDVFVLFYETALARIS